MITDFLILLSSIVAGALTVFLFKLRDRAHVKLLNSFTGAFLLSLTFLHLLPELYEHGASKVDDHLYLGVLILAGFFVQIVLEAFTMGVEHGHAHHVHGHLPVSVLAGLCLHAFVEALALGDPHRTYDPASRSMLLWSIVLHNYPVSIALLGMLLSSGLKESRALWFLGLFAIMAPLGVTISTFTPLANHSRELMAVVIGIFMHISTTILFESSDGHRFNQRKTMAIVLGTALGFLSVFLHG